jgi:hypothetical protein
MQYGMFSGSCSYVLLLGLGKTLSLYLPLLQLMGIWVSSALLFWTLLLGTFFIYISSCSHNYGKYLEVEMPGHTVCQYVTWQDAKRFSKVVSLVYTPTTAHKSPWHPTSPPTLAVITQPLNVCPSKRDKTEAHGDLDSSSILAPCTFLSQLISQPRDAACFLHHCPLNK